MCVCVGGITGDVGKVTHWPLTLRGYARCAQFITETGERGSRHGVERERDREREPGEGERV